MAVDFGATADEADLEAARERLASRSVVRSERAWTEPESPAQRAAAVVETAEPEQYEDQQSSALDREEPDRQVGDLDYEQIRDLVHQQAADRFKSAAAGGTGPRKVRQRDRQR